MGGFKKKVGKFFRKLGFGPRRRGGGEDEDGGGEVTESTESNSEVLERISRKSKSKGRPRTDTPLLDQVGSVGPDGDNARSEVESEEDLGFGSSSNEEDSEEDGGTSPEPVLGLESEDPPEDLGGGGTTYTVRRDPEVGAPQGDQDEQSDDSSSSSSSSSEVRPRLVAPPSQGARGDVQAVLRFLERGPRGRWEVISSVLGDDARRYDAALAIGRSEGVFWEARGTVHERTSLLTKLAEPLLRSVLLYPELGERDLLDQCPDPRMDDHPLRKRDILAFALERGLIAPTNDGFEVLTAGLGAIARVRSEPGDGQKRDERGNGQGWATMGMLSVHGDRDRDTGVTYHNTKEEREPTVLRLEGGVFTWAGTGEEVSGPDTSGLDVKKDHQQIFAMAPNFVHLRQKQLVSEGLSNNDSYGQALQEVLNNPRLIFVMDGGGTFYATQAKLGEIHHSTLLGGLDVAAAGEIALSGGKVTYVSDASGHYMPGPGYTWQALHEMGAAGVNMGGVDVEMFGVNQMVKASWFLRNFVPGVNLAMKGPEAVRQVNNALSGDVDKGGEAPDPGGRMGVEDPPRVRAPARSTSQDQQDEESSSSSETESEEGVRPKPALTFTYHRRVDEDVVVSDSGEESLEDDEESSFGYGSGEESGEDDEESSSTESGEDDDVSGPSGYHVRSHRKSGRGSRS